MCWRSDRYTIDRIDVRTFSITVRCKPVGAAVTWSLTTLYGPHDSERKRAFLNELADLHNALVGPWIIIGDFNLIKDLHDKNNDCINRTWMRRFCQTLNSSSLHEIPLIGRRYTWSNEQANPTLVRLDRAFCNIDSEMLFPAAKLVPKSTAISDHCPLLLMNEGIV